MRRLRLLFLLSGIFCLSATAQTPFTTGDVPTLVVSSLGLNDTGGGLLFNHPTGLASDGTRLIVCDRWNNRVLVWHQAPTGNTPPDLVLGQPNFDTRQSGSGLHEMNFPGEAAATPDGRLIVADTNNDRLLIWNTFPTQNGQPADLSIDFWAANPDPHAMGPFGWPWGVWTDGTRLVASSTRGGALYVWNTFPTETNQKADYVIQLPDYLGTPRGIVSDGNFLLVGEHNHPAYPGQKGNHVWTTFPTGNTPPEFFFQDTDSNYAWFQGDFTDDGRLVVLGRTLSVWNQYPTAPYDLPDVRVEWSFDGGDGPDVEVIGERVYIAAHNYNKIVGYHTLPTQANQPPDFFIGSSTLEENTLKTYGFIPNPLPVSNGTSLFVGSDFDRMLYVWSSLPKEDGQKYDYQIPLQFAPVDLSLWGHQLFMATGDGLVIWDELPTSGQAPSRIYSEVNGVRWFSGVARDDHHFYLADPQARKVYVWNEVPSSPNHPPAFSLDVPGSARLHSDGRTLTVSVYEPPYIAFYDVATLSASAKPIAIYEREMHQNSEQVPLNLPQHAITFGDTVFVANTVNNQVLIWPHLEQVGDPNHVIVLGQQDYLDTMPGTGPGRMHFPGYLSFDGQRLWVGEFKFSNSIFMFGPPPSPVSREDHGTPSSSFVRSVFPNPFRDAASLEIELIEPATVRLTVFDLLGRRVHSTLPTRYAPGHHILRMDTAAWPAGVYLLRLDVNGNNWARPTIKMR